MRAGIAARQIRVERERLTVGDVPPCSVAEGFRVFRHLTLPPFPYGLRLEHRQFWPDTRFQYHEILTAAGCQRWHPTWYHSGTMTITLTVKKVPVAWCCSLPRSGANDDIAVHRDRRPAAARGHRGRVRHRARSRAVDERGRPRARERHRGLVVSQGRCEGVAGRDGPYLLRHRIIGFHIPGEQQGRAVVVTHHRVGSAARHPVPPSLDDRDAHGSNDIRGGTISVP